LTEKNRNLLVRIASALLLLPVVIALLWAGGGWSAGLMAFVAAVVAAEFYGIALTKGADHVRWLGVLAAGALPIAFSYLPRQVPLAPAMLVPMAWLFACFAYYLLKGPLAQATTKAALTFFGALYAGLGIGALGSLRDLPHGLEWVLLAILLTFGNDTGAYFAGRALGKHKLYVEVSPNKTWEGFFGGMVFTVALVFVARATFLHQLSALDAIGLGIPCSLLGPAGDLCESMLKRAHGVKDSGWIIPGHGGLLDRVDALLFNAPYVLFYALARFG